MASLTLPRVQDRVEEKMGVEPWGLGKGGVVDEVIPCLGSRDLVTIRRFRSGNEEFAPEMRSVTRCKEPRSEIIITNPFVQYERTNLTFDPVMDRSFPSPYLVAFPPSDIALKFLLA